MPFDGVPSNLPPDAEIARLNSRRADPRWEGFKGFFQGSLPALALGAIAGLAVGALATAGIAIFGTLPALSVFGLGNIASTMLVTGGSVAIASGAISGVMGAAREVREAHMKNYSIERAINAVHENALAGMAPQMLPEEQREISRSRALDRILSTGRAATPSGFADRLQQQVAEQAQGNIKLH